jgi:hypothetical protein
MNASVFMLGEGTPVSKELHNLRFLTPEQVAPPQGVPTGMKQLDQFLLWKGFPKSAVSLISSPVGMGATTLWLSAAHEVTAKKQWVAWVNGPDTQLTPWSLSRRGVDRSRLLWVSPPRDLRQTLWALQELMSLSLFELIGCDLGAQTLKEHQILKLKKICMRYQTALVLVSSSSHLMKSSFFSLILDFQKNHISIERALHKPTPTTIERRQLYADTLPQLAAGRKALCR